LRRAVATRTGSKTERLRAAGRYSSGAIQCFARPTSVPRRGGRQIDDRCQGGILPSWRSKSGHRGSLTISGTPKRDGNEQLVMNATGRHKRFTVHEGARTASRVESARRPHARRDGACRTLRALQRCCSCEAIQHKPSLSPPWRHYGCSHSACAIQEQSLSLDNLPHLRRSTHIGSTRTAYHLAPWFPALPSM
jgi:hypothetical protein